MFKIFPKELKAFISDKRAVMLTLLLPAVLITVFSLAFGAGNGGGIDKIPILVADQDKSDLSKQTISQIDSVKMLIVIPVKYDSGIDLVMRGKRSAMLIFPKGFSDSAKASKNLPWLLKYDAAQSEELGILQQLLSQGLYKNTGKLVGLEGDGGSSYNIDRMKDMIQSKIKLNTEPVISAKQTDAGLVHAVAGTAVMMLLFSLTGMGGSILDEKEHGTLKRLLYSPIRSSDILLGKMGAYICVALFQLTVMFGFSSLIFGLKVSDKIVPISILIFATAFACSGFGVFLATLAKSRQQLQGMSTLIILSMSVLGGSMVPTFIMPQWMQHVSAFTINYWSIQGFYDILWRQIPMGSIFFTRIAVLFLIGLVLVTLAFRFFRRNVLALA